MVKFTSAYILRSEDVSSVEVATLGCMFTLTDTARSIAGRDKNVEINDPTVSRTFVSRSI